VDQIFYGEPRLYQGDLIRCQCDHGDYACSHSGVVVPGGDGTYSTTQVPVCQVHVSAYELVLSYMALTVVAI
jgi:hypothetical protein